MMRDCTFRYCAGGTAPAVFYGVAGEEAAPPPSRYFRAGYPDVDNDAVGTRTPCCKVDE